MKHFLLVFGILFIGNFVKSQTNDTISIMSYNLLNFPNGRDDCGASNVVVPERYDTLRKILHFAKPDIFVACEIQNKAGSDSILSRSLNVNGVNNYQKANYVANTSSGDDLQNMLYYNTDKLELLWQDVINTSIRDISHYVLFVKDPNLMNHYDTIFYEVYMCHLKAGSTVPDETDRNYETQLLRSYIDNRPPHRNHFVCGDLNVYRSTEPCYQTLTTGGVRPLKDPINMPGNWNNNGTFESIHSQATRSSGLFDCGSVGGMDDRFDQILATQNVLSNSDRVSYLNGSYKAIGNDGNHYNQSLISSPLNTMYPDSVVKALYYMSDHLPVYMKTVAHHPITNGLALTYNTSSVTCFGESDGTATVTPNNGTPPYSYSWDAAASFQTTQTAFGLTSGYYCVIVEDSFNQTDEICLEIVEPPLLNAGVFPSGSDMPCNGSAFVIANGGVGPYTFLWNDPSAQTTETATNLCPGNYTCTITDFTGCFQQVSITIVDQSSGINENNSVETLFQFINDENKLTIKNVSNLLIENVRIQIANFSGQIVSQVNFGTVLENENLELNLDTISKGVYFIQISTNFGNIVYQFIK